MHAGRGLTADTPRLDRIATWYLSTLPAPTHQTQRVLKRLYRMLLTGNAVSVDELAEIEPTDFASLVDDLAGWVLFDADRRIDSSYGLTLRPTPHRVSVNGQRAFAYCPWDAVFLPLLLGDQVKLTTSCPVSGQRIDMVTTPEGIRRITPRASVMSFTTPPALSIAETEDTAIERRQRKKQSIEQICGSVHLFCQASWADRWGAAKNDIHVLSPDEAFQLARNVHLKVFDDDW